MSKNEYFDKLIVEYQKQKEKENKKYFSHIVKSVLFLFILLLIILFLFYLRNVFKGGILGAVSSVSLVIFLLSIIYIFSFLLNIIEIVHLISHRKKMLNYLTEKKQFNYQSIMISKDVFDFSLTFAGFMAMYTRINGKIYYLEAQLKNIAGTGEEIEIGDCYVNFYDAMTKDEFLNYEIEGIKIKDIENFELLSVNFGDPIKFLDEYNKFKIPNSKE